MSTAVAPVTTSTDLVRRGRLLEYLTVGWNLVEAVVAVGAAVATGSVALLGFGIDSVVESFSGGVLLWRLQHGEAGEQREKLALRLVGVSFLILAAYVAFDAVKALVMVEPPDSSFVGVALTLLSAIVMPLLARAKRRVGERMGSGALVADSRQTSICAYLSVIVLGGLVLNAAFGLWWADPVAALVMVPIIAREGLEALRGESCECHTSASPRSES